MTSLTTTQDALVSAVNAGGIMVKIRKTTVVSRYEAREVRTGVWEWRRILRVVSIPFFAVLRSFGWVEGGMPPMPTGDPANPKDRVRSMRGG